MTKELFTKDDIRDFIIYGLTKNRININSTISEKIDKVVEDYYIYYNEFKAKYIRGELDTFKLAACLLVAINKNNLVPDKYVNASVAIDASEKMYEKPYCNLGNGFGIPQKLEEVDFETIREEEKVFYYKHRSQLTDILMNQNSVWPIEIYLSIELFYWSAIQIKKNSTRKIDSCSPQENTTEHSSDISISKSKSRRRFLSLFKK